jgi:hypothetical protein
VLRRSAILASTYDGAGGFDPQPLVRAVSRMLRLRPAAGRAGGPGEACGTASRVVQVCGCNSSYSRTGLARALPSRERPIKLSNAEGLANLPTARELAHFLTEGEGTAVRIRHAASPEWKECVVLVPRVPALRKYDASRSSGIPTYATPFSFR